MTVDPDSLTARTRTGSMKLQKTTQTAEAVADVDDEIAALLGDD